MKTTIELLDNKTGGQKCRDLVLVASVSVFRHQLRIVILNSYPPLAVALHLFEHSIMETALILIFGLSVAPISKMYP